MSAMSDYLEQKLLDLAFNKVAFPGPATYVALFTTAPADDGTGGVEVSVGAYARQLVNENAGGSPKWNVAVTEGGGGFLVDNLDDIVWPTATAAWGTVVAAAIFDALTVGNMLVHGNLTVDKPVTQDDTFKFLAGELDNIFK